MKSIVRKCAVHITVFSLVLACLAGSIAGCSQNNGQASKNPTPTATPSSAPVSGQTPAPDPSAAPTSEPTAEPTGEPTPTQAQESSADPARNVFAGTAQEILDGIVAKAGELMADDEYGIQAIPCSDVPVDAESCEDILGLSEEEMNQYVEEAIESKPDGSWFNHSVVVIRLKDGVNTAEVAEKIVKNTNPARFGCIKAGAIVGGYTDRVVFFAASESDVCEAVYEAAESLCSGGLTRLDRENDWDTGGLMGGID